MAVFVRPTVKRHSHLQFSVIHAAAHLALLHEQNSVEKYNNITPKGYHIWANILYHATETRHKCFHIAAEV